MKIYKYIFCLYILLITCGCSNKNTSVENSSTGLSINLKLLKEYYVPDSIFSGYDYESLPKYINNKRYDIQVSLENQTDSIVNIVMMTCSWDESFIINTPYITYAVGDCNSNHPQIITINSHSKKLLTTTLEKSKYIHECESCPEYSKSVILKLGLIYITEVKDKPFYKEYFRIMEDKSLWNIIWSTPLKIDKQ